MSLVAENTKDCQFNFIFSSPKRLKNLLVFKDRLPLNLRSFVIYKFKCSSCDATYIGKTFRHFRQRVGEHIGQSHLTDKTFKNRMVTAVSQHSVEEKHKACWDDFEVIGVEHSRNDLHLKLKESLLIKKLRLSLVNKTSESVKLFA